MAGGKVWLVGAGPGDAGLLTIRAKEVIEQADVIAYDALVGESILCTLPETAEKISVGKRCGRHSVPQEETNRLLLECALAGKKTVRLKGGDPFLFGRGGEELELIAQNGIPFEVVPGITSASAVPAYAGIPLTHREYASSFHVVTGHFKAGREDRTDYRALVRMNATLVFLMGVNRLELIMEQLMAAGMDKEMPAAVIESGTRYNQRKVISRVKCLGEDAKKAGISAPAVIVVGRVCALADEFSWYEKKPLSGRRIIVTHSRPEELAALLRRDGAEVLELPAIRRRILKERDMFTKFEEETAEKIWLTFMSPAAVESFFTAAGTCTADMRCIFRDGRSVGFAAAGAATAKKLRSYGWKADFVPEVYSAKSLGAILAEQTDSRTKVFLIGAKEISADITEELKRTEVRWEHLAVYETVPGKWTCPEDVIRQVVNDTDGLIVTFSSGSAVRAFVKTVQGTDISRLTALCIGKKTAQEAEKYGMYAVVSERAAVDSMADKIKELTV